MLVITNSMCALLGNVLPWHGVLNSAGIRYQSVCSVTLKIQALQKKTTIEVCIFYLPMNLLHIHFNVQLRGLETEAACG